MSVNWRSSGLRWAIGTIVLVVALALLGGQLAERRTLAALRAQAAIDARLRAVLLDSELARFRLLPLALADDRDVVAAIAGAPDARTALNRKLEALAGETGAPAIYVVSPEGIAIAASNWRTASSFVGNDYRFRPYFREAQATGAGSQYAMGTISHRPGLYLARRTVSRGVIVVKLEFDRIEREWARAGGISIVRNPLGVVFATSRPEWRFAASGPLRTADKARIRAETRVPAAALAPLPLRPIADGRLRGAGATYVAQDVPVAQRGWRLTLLHPVDAEVASARRATALIVAMVTFALAAFAFALRQRATLARRRTAELEEAVAERTAALRREMTERADSEARAADLREALRQANRLASLGQITASVAHETAQPVAAIRTYAQSSDILLGRGAIDEVRGNLSAIARLADRIGAVTAQLRGFARRRSDELRPVAIAEVIDGAVLILKDQLRAATLDRPDIDPGMTVIGGKVRLEQVLVILMQNALEAMANQDDRRITLTLAMDEGAIRLIVADNGPGVAPEIAERLFTPFVTSRQQGLGLGLAIAQDIMEEMSGALRLMPSLRGACFEIAMRRA
ncbi:sensor histidine kinase [Sphingomonas sp. CCH5-D11]|uniref:sensor histidine kinase n=1 Tax=Sphingomonas sp. CCH5-D11 TaxID=1768786 RepID=UPI0008379E4A|nr:ATP-binding protein [Sphingomonas sp. CCH5-D11]